MKEVSSSIGEADQPSCHVHACRAFTCPPPSEIATKRVTSRHLSRYPPITSSALRPIDASCDRSMPLANSRVFGAHVRLAANAERWGASLLAGLSFAFACALATLGAKMAAPSLIKAILLIKSVQPGLASAQSGGAGSAHSATPQDRRHARPWAGAGATASLVVQ